MDYRFNWKIGGRAGEGISAAGFLLGKVSKRHGLNVFEYGEYPSLIRGGHTTSQVHASSVQVFCQTKIMDLMVALNEDALKLHLDEFGPHTKILLDPDVTKFSEEKYPQIQNTQLINAPLLKISREATGKSLAADVVALAISCVYLGLNEEVFNGVLKEFFTRKGQEVIDENLKASSAGFAWGKANLTDIKPTLEVIKTEQLYLSGTEALGLAAISAGCQYYAAYPMTPTSNLMHFMASMQEKYPIIVKHAEDEISAINHVVGAAFTGVRSMTASAGGGFALMVEGVSLAAVMETPLVVVVGGRPGPATGLPTWTCQTDLQYVMNSGHGEFPRIVFSPGNIEESFKLTRLAFILAEKYHTQAYILSDKLLLESRMTGPNLNEEYENIRYSFAADPLPEDDSYRRFKVTPEGYSPRSIPGQAHGLQLTNSYEHDEYGYATEDATIAKSMMEKRLRKWEGISKEVPPPVLIGPSSAEQTLVCWGSSRLVVEEVMRQLNVDGDKVNAIHILTMLPFKKEEFIALAKQAKQLVMIEGNALHQAADHIFVQTGIKIEHHINRYDGRPFYAEDVISELKNI
jgi:2-oxoglutarate ferredoxin oxidoreductase subunit alpha